MADDTRYHYAGLVLVVDAVESTRAELGNNVQVADLVVVNKADQVSDAELEAVRAKITALNDRVPVLPTEFGRVDPELLVDPPQQVPRVAQLSLDELLWETYDHDHHEHATFQSVAFTSDVPLDPRRFMDLLKNRPAGMYRAKGFVDFGDAGEGRKFVLQLVGGSLRFERRRWDRGEARRTSLVLIGTDIDEAAALSALQGCATAEPADKQAILGVLRYTD